MPGCAAREPPADSPQGDELARAGALIREGCYRCLEEASALARPLATSSPAARAVAFDAALLLAVRDRELGLRSADHLPLARALAPGGEDERSRVLLAVVEAMPWPTAANGPGERDRSVVGWRTLAPVVPAWYSFLTGRPEDDVSGRYALAAVECTWAHLLPDAARGGESAPQPPAPPAPRGDEPPVVQFRHVVCGHPSLDEVLEMRRQVPRYEELDLIAGDVAMSGGALLSAERHYQEALRAFPSMLPAAHGLARVHVMLEEYETSLPEYDVVLAAVPDQQDCLLGKARALSQLGRHAEALALLDRLIELGTWLVGDAHYWRGWNRLQVGDVDGAAADAERALTLMVNARVHVLAGAVATRRAEWERAGREFEAALPLDETDCDIPVSLGAVRGQQRDWHAAFTSYARAADCLVDWQAQLSRRVAEITAAEMSADRRERFLARTRAAVGAARRLEGQSRYNAAVSLANQGRIEEARPWAAQAAAWPEWKERAETLVAPSRSP